MSVDAGGRHFVGKARNAIIIFGALALAITSFSRSAATILASKGSPLAYSFDPGERSAAALNAFQLLQQQAFKPDPQGVKSARDMMRNILRREPMHAASLRVFAFTTSLMGNAAASKQQLLLAQSLSRRELGTQVALIQFCVEAEDVPCALEHYATALATRKEAGELLNKRLTDALDNPEIRAAFLPYVRRGEPWTGRLLNFASQNATDPVSVAQVIIDAGFLPRALGFSGAEQTLLLRLFYAERPDIVRALYLHTRGTDPSVLYRANFTASSTAEDRVPVHWQLLATETGSADFERLTGSVALRASATTRTPAVVARKLMFVGPGTYTLRQNVDRESVFGESSKWRATCVPTGATSPGYAAFGRPVTALVVPNCAVWVLELVLSAPRDGDANVIVHAISLDRAQNPTVH